jgi:cephalosporin-C deacetylase-like acetyl esterase
MQRLMLCVLTTLFCLPNVPIARGEDLDLPPQTIEGGPPTLMMQRYLRRQTDGALQRWKNDYEKRKTPEQIAEYQKRVRAAFVAAVGGMPERTPLNAKVVATISRQGYRVEKVIFESQPKHYVTGLLFLPDPQRFKPRYPGVLVPCGHAFEAKGYEAYQAMGALLALNGMAALVFDPIDQGERGQYMGEGGWPKLWGIDGHTVIGIGSIPLGRNTAQFEIWDGIRAIDYLQSRPEVDPDRIGCTGNSGGATQTSYLMALDDRIKAAAPSCYLMNTERLLVQRGADDAEQQIFNQLNTGPHEADFIMLRAPSPVLVCCATYDFFDVVGTWDTMRYAKRLFTRMGFAERVDVMENDAGHNYDTLQREAVARWMSRWLLHKDQVITEPKIGLLSEKEYNCTPDGKVMSLPGARSVYDLNEDYENRLAKQRDAAWSGGDQAALLKQVRQLAGVRAMSDLPKPKVEVLATFARTGYKLEKLAIRPEEGIVLPALLFLPEKSNPGVVLYLHDKGKAADAAAGGPIEQRVKAGDAVLAVDLRGNGQTQSTTPGMYGSEYQDGQIAFELGRSIVGMRAEDVLVCARYAAERTSGGPNGSVELVAIGNIGIPALHAAALEPVIFRNVTLRGMLVSWSNIIHNRMNKSSLMGSIIHGALQYYDLPNLEATLGKKIKVEQPAVLTGNVSLNPDQPSH